MNDEMVSAAVTEAARHGAIVTAHARSAESIAMAARTGVQLIHHACFLDDAAMRSLEDRRDDVWVCPGLHYVYAMVHGHADPWGMTSDRLERSGYRRELESLVDQLAEAARGRNPDPRRGRLRPPVDAPRHLRRRAQRYVELVGMTPVEAIHTATRNTAPLVGLDTGEVREGCLADLVVLDGDPTADIALLQRPDRRRAVMKGGRFVYVNPELSLERDPRTRGRRPRRSGPRGGTLGGRGARAPAAHPPRARPAGRADDGHHGLGLPGVAARHLRPRARGGRRPRSRSTGSSTVPASTRSWPPPPSGAARWGLRCPTAGSTASSGSGTARLPASTGQATP